VLNSSSANGENYRVLEDLVFGIALVGVQQVRVAHVDVHSIVKRDVPSVFLAGEDLCSSAVALQILPLREDAVDNSRPEDLTCLKQKNASLIIYSHKTGCFILSVPHLPWLGSIARGGFISSLVGNPWLGVLNRVQEITRTVLY
jgi:hypothetical protein